MCVCCLQRLLLALLPKGSLPCSWKGARGEREREIRFPASETAAGGTWALGPGGGQASTAGQARATDACLGKRADSQVQPALALPAGGRGSDDGAAQALNPWRDGAQPACLPAVPPPRSYGEEARQPCAAAPGRRRRRSAPEPGRCRRSSSHCDAAERSFGTLNSAACLGWSVVAPPSPLRGSCEGPPREQVNGARLHPHP